MARDTTDSSPVEGFDALVGYMAQGEKPESGWRIGTEHEKFPFYVDGNAPVPYGGDHGIRALLEGMREVLGWDPIVDAGHIIGLVEPTGQGAISLEPGGQFELSGAPLENLHDTCKETNLHLSLVREIAEPLGIAFLGMGGSPKWTFDETPRMPKSRYAIMTRYMPKVGTKGLDMMYRTCTIQVNLDFSSEADMRRKMQVSLKLQSLSTALFASSPFTDGKPNGLKSWRGDIWTDTDNQRSGLLPLPPAQMRITFAPTLRATGISRRMSFRPSSLAPDSKPRGCPEDHAGTRPVSFSADRISSSRAGSKSGRKQLSRAMPLAPMDCARPIMSMSVNCSSGLLSMSG